MLLLTSASEAPVLLVGGLRAAGVERTKPDGGAPYLTTDPFAGPNNGKEPEFGEILNMSHRRYQAFRERFF